MMSLSNLASLYNEQGWHTEAEPLYQRVVQHRERTLGLEHPSTAISLNNLASVLQAQPHYEEE